MRKLFKKLMALSVVAALAVSITGCATTSIDATKYDAIVDVRTPAEFAEGHVQGAINIDVEAGDFLAKIEQLDKKGDYILYCRSGNRAGIALDQMKNAGFTGNIVNAGGFQEASDATKLPLVTN